MLELRIPTPPSSNHRLVVMGGRSILAPEHRAWMREAVRAIRAQLPAGYVRPQGPVLLRAVVEVPTLASDVSNRLKSLEDALTEAGVWDDDRQVGEIHARKVIGRKGGCEVLVRVEGLDHPELAERLSAAQRRALKPRRPRSRKVKLGGLMATPNVRRAR